MNENVQGTPWNLAWLLRQATTIGGAKVVMLLSAPLGVDNLGTFALTMVSETPSMLPFPTIPSISSNSPAPPTIF